MGFRGLGFKGLGFMFWGLGCGLGLGFRVNYPYSGFGETLCAPGRYKPAFRLADQLEEIKSSEARYRRSIQLETTTCI